MDRLSTETLGAVPETMLIPLAARLSAARLNPDLKFIDPAAQAVGERLAFDPARFADDRASMRGSIVRALWFDGVARRFVAAHPDALCISIGSGLDTRPHRLDLPATIDWVDIELPDGAALRETAVAPLRGTRTIAADGCAVEEWLSQVPWHEGRLVLVLAEGVTMYLALDAAEGWLRSLASAARMRRTPLTLAFDFASPFMVRHSRRNPSVGRTHAHFTWSLRDAADVARIAPGLEVFETYDVASRSGFVSRVIGGLHRLLCGGRPLYACTIHQLNGAL